MPIWKMWRMIAMLTRKETTPVVLRMGSALSLQTRHPRSEQADSSRKEEKRILSVSQVPSVFSNQERKKKLYCEKIFSFWCGFGWVNWAESAEKWPTWASFLRTRFSTLWQHWLWPRFRLTCVIIHQNKGDEIQVSSRVSGLSPSRCEEERAGVGAVNTGMPLHSGLPSLTTTAEGSHALCPMGVDEPTQGKGWQRMQLAIILVLITEEVQTKQAVGINCQVD